MDDKTSLIALRLQHQLHGIGVKARGIALDSFKLKVVTL